MQQNENVNDEELQRQLSIDQDKQMDWLTSNMEKLNLLKKENKVGFCFDERMLLHKDFDNAHLERPERAMSIYLNLINKGLVEKMSRVNVTKVSRELLLKVHPEDYISKIQGLEDVAFIDKSGARLCYDTIDNYYTYSSALLSCGGLINCCDQVLEGNLTSAFAIIRPPGHHATEDVCSGFCFFNNVAVAAKYLIGKTTKDNRVIEKVAIVDWDVHSGNGTQKIFSGDDQVLFISIHKYDKATFYPYLTEGNYTHTGKGKGEGFTINIPWDTKNRFAKSGESIGVNDEEYISAFEEIVIPVLKEFQPDFILVSSGFDAAENDDLGKLNLTPFAYYSMTRSLTQLNSNVVVALEGGYNLDSLARCSEGVVRALLNENHTGLPIIDPDYKKFIDSEQNYETLISRLSVNPIYLEDLVKMRNHFTKFWKTISPNKLNSSHLKTHSKPGKSGITEESYFKLRFSQSSSHSAELRFDKKTTLHKNGFRLIFSNIEGFALDYEETSCNVTEKQLIMLLSKFISTHKITKESLIKAITTYHSNLDDSSTNIETEFRVSIQSDDLKEEGIKSRLRSTHKSNVCSILSSNLQCIESKRPAKDSVLGFIEFIKTSCSPSPSSRIMIDEGIALFLKNE